METCGKYNLSPSLIAKWKQRYQAKGSEGLKPAYRKVDPEVRALKEENGRLDPIQGPAVKLQARIRHTMMHWFLMSMLLSASKNSSANRTMPMRYQSVTDDLRALGYLVNHKKTYRLMNVHKLLLGKVIRTKGKRKLGAIPED